MSAGHFTACSRQAASSVSASGAADTSEGAARRTRPSSARTASVADARSSVRRTTSVCSSSPSAASIAAALAASVSSMSPSMPTSQGWRSRSASTRFTASSRPSPSCAISSSRRRRLSRLLRSSRSVARRFNASDCWSPSDATCSLCAAMSRWMRSSASSATRRCVCAVSRALRIWSSSRRRRSRRTSARPSSASSDGPRSCTAVRRPSARARSRSTPATASVRRRMACSAASICSEKSLRSRVKAVTSRSTPVIASSACVASFTASSRRDACS